MRVVFLTLALFLTVFTAFDITTIIVAVKKSMENKKEYSKNIVFEMILIFLTCLFWSLFLLN